MIKEKIKKILNKIILIGIFSIVILSPLIVEGSFYSYKLLFIQLALSVVIFCFGLKILTGGNDFFFSKLFIPVFCYILVIIYAYLISPYPEVSKFALLKNFTFVSFLFVLVFSIDSYEILNRLIKAWVITACIVALYGILQFLNFDFLGIYYKDLRIFSTMGNPNFLAAYLVFTLPLCYSQIILSSSKIFKFVLLTCCLLIIFCILLTFSRGGYLGFLVSGFVYFFILIKIDKSKRFKIWVKNHKVHIVIFFLLFFLVAAGLFFGAEGFRNKIVNIITRPTARFYVWQGGVKMAISNPFKGFGLGTFAVFFPNFRPEQVLSYHPAALQYVKHAHNLLLETWIETGIIGLGVYISLILTLIFVPAFLVIKNKGYNFKNLILTASISSFCSIVIMNLVSVSIYYAVGGIFFWGIAGILVLLSKHHFPSSQFSKSKKLTRFFCSFFIISFSFILVGCSTSHFNTRIEAEKQKQKQLFFYIDNKINRDFEALQDKIKKGKVKAEHYYALGTIFAKRRDWDNALVNLTKAVKLDSEYVDAYNNLGNIYFHKDNIDKAIESYKKAVKYNPRFINARYNLGMMYFKTGEIEKTIKQMKSILKINPDNYEAKLIVNVIGE